MKKKTTHFLISSFIIIVLVYTSIMAFYAITMSRKTKNVVEDVATIYMEGINVRTTKHFRSTIESKLDLVYAILKNCVPTKYNNRDELMSDIAEHGKLHGFEHMAFYDKNGEFINIYGEDLTLVDNDSFFKSITSNNKKVAVGKTASGEDIIVLGIPTNVYPLENGDNSIAFVAAVSVNFVNDALSLDEESSLAYSHIIRRDGSFVIGNKYEINTNYFDLIREEVASDVNKTSDEYVEELKNSMKNREEYSQSLSTSEQRMMQLYCTPLPDSEWYLVTIMPYDRLNTAFSDLEHLRIFMFIINLCITLIVFLTIFIIYFRMTQKQIYELDNARRKEISANHAKSEFLSNMSHDIRTPMNAVMGMTSIAQNNIDDKAQVENCLRKISVSGKHLLGLINDVLDMSKIESGKMTLNPDVVSLNEEIESIVSIIRMQAKEKQQKFDVYLENLKTENIICDGVRLNQVIINFLSNAVKFTPVGGEISFSISEEESSKGDNFCRMKIGIKDNGIGMSEDFQKIIFQSFTREDSKRVNKTQGTGLGMAISKYIVDAMGGTIDINSELNKGTEFVVTLDFEKAEINEEEAVFPNWNVLVVDDDEMICKSTVSILRSLGMNAESVLDGESTLRRLEKNPDYYNVIIIDWQLPNIDGIETARRIRERTTKKIPILLISAYDWSDIEENAKEAGIDDFISKPLFRSTIIRAFNRIVNQNQAGDKTPNKKQAIGAGLKVLVAEDNDLNWEIAETLLKEKGFSCERAENGKICLDMLANENDFDAVLMDIRMPIMDGFEATREIRKLGGKAGEIPIIAMTADAFAEDMKKCLECGMNAHIAKPIDIDEVEKVLEKYII